MWRLRRTQERAENETFGAVNNFVLMVGVWPAGWLDWGWVYPLDIFPDLFHSHTCRSHATAQKKTVALKFKRHSCTGVEWSCTPLQFLRWGPQPPSPDLLQEPLTAFLATILFHTHALSAIISSCARSSLSASPAPTPHPSVIMRILRNGK